MRIHKIIIILIYTILGIGLCNTTYAQREKTKTVEVTGMYVAGDDVPPSIGKARALLEAKKNALREAGVQEDVYAISVISINSSNTDFKEISSELGRIALEGRIRILQQKDNPPKVNDDNLLIYSTTIRAEVVVEEETEDLNFVCKISGFKEAYRENEKLTFAVTPKQDCYLRVFLFGPNKNSNGIIYPLDAIFKDIQLTANQEVVFPPEKKEFLYDKEFEYTLGKDTDNPVEQDIVLIVALKHPYPFVDEVNFESVMNWLSRIKRNEKFASWHGINIIK